MSSSPNSSMIVRRTIDLQYANRKRSRSLKWSIVNGVLLMVFAYDLSCKCVGYTTIMHYVEACLAGILAANLIQHALQLLPHYGDPVTLTQQQQRLLGLSDADLDSSFRVTDAKDVKSDSHVQTPEPEPLPLMIGARRSPSPHSPPSPQTPHSSYNASFSQSHYSSNSQYSPQSPSSPFDRNSRDEFISDNSTLSDYLKQYEERSMNESRLAESSSYQQYHQHPVTSSYQLSPLQVDTKQDESSPPGSPQLWWRLHLNPTRLTQFNQNLRLWIHMTILERLVREMATIDDALAKHGLTDVRMGEVPIERLRKVAASGTSGMESLPALILFLEPFSEQRYVVRRIRELSRGGCLSEYKWDGGGTDWDDTKPTDSELLMHLFATYLDGQIGPEGVESRPFSAQHVSSAPAAPPLAPGALCIHRVSRRPPHYVLCAATDTLEVARGRNNLLHTILLLIACCARANPPALRRRHLGRAALNMLWIIGR